MTRPAGKREGKHSPSLLPAAGTKAKASAKSAAKTKASKGAPPAKTPAPKPQPPAVPPANATKPRQPGAASSKTPPAQTGMTLHTAAGARKYLTEGERAAFLQEADISDRQVRTFCMTLAYAGCRLSEALALTADRVDLAAGVLVFESLKKRTDGIFRAVPVPPALLDTLDMVHGIREAQTRRGKGRGELLWPWSRMTGWRAVHAVMAAAGLDGPHASPKGLRHGFGVAAVCAGIPLNLVQKWLGHAQLTTTAIYANAVGAEEKTIASRMWG